MIEIVNIDNGIIRPTEQVLLIEPFKTIWANDKDSHKANAIKDFTFIEFMTSPLTTNPYKDLEDDKKEISIIEEVFNNNYKPSKEVYSCIEIYKKWIYDYSFAYKFLEATVRGAKELINFFNSVDISERTKSGNTVYKPADLTRALKDVEDIIKNLTSLEKRVFEELKENKIKGNKDINPLEI